TLAPNQIVLKTSAIRLNYSRRRKFPPGAPTSKTRLAERVRNAPRPALRLFGGDSLLLAHLRAAEPCLRRSDARAELDLDADIVHRHLGAGDRAEQHELVEIAAMADAEQLAGHL